MKTLLVFICVILGEIWAKTYTCAFHEYVHSNHYRSRQPSAKEHFARHEVKQ